MSLIVILLSGFSSTKWTLYFFLSSLFLMVWPYYYFLVQRLMYVTLYPISGIQDFIIVFC